MNGTQRMNSWACIAVTLAAVGSMLMPPVWAQQDRERERERSRRTTALTLPAGQEMLRLEVETPGQVRVSNDFEYYIHVSNLTDDVVLHDIQVAQQSPQQFVVEKAHFEDDGSHHQADQHQADQAKAKAGQAQAKKGQPGQATASQQDAGEKQKQAKQEKKAKDRSAQGKNQQVKTSPNQQVASKSTDSQPSLRKADKATRPGEQMWTISQLNPGETRTICVHACSDQEGRQQMCLMVKSFTPALCVDTRFTKPELEVAMKLPKQANVCEPFEMELFVKNAGSGSLETLRIQSDLPAGIALENGEETIDFEIDGLDADEVRKFVATVVASQPGSFKTRAIATAPGDLKARSKQHSIEIRAADLAIAIDGPKQLYIEREATYTIRVTNQGNAPARDATLALHFPRTAGLVSTGQVRQSDQHVAATTTREGDADQRQTVGYRPQNADSQKDSPQASNAQRERSSAMEEWSLGDLEPDETKMVKLTLRPDQAEQMRLSAIARHACGEEQVEARTTAKTEVISVPALAIAVIDQSDPVGVDEEVTYKIHVLNEGTAAAEQLNVEVQLPKQLAFVSGSGDSKVNAKEGALNFATVEQLEPGDEATWQVRCRVKQAGEIRFPVTVTTSDLEKPIKAQEPTRLIP